MPFLAAVPAALGVLATAATATTAEVAAASLTLSATAATIGAVGVGVAGYSAYKQSQFQASVAANNALIAKNNANSALESGSVAESNKKLETGEKIGSELAAQGANGVDVGFGSPASVRQGTANAGELDALTIRHNAQLAALGYEQQSAGFTTESKLDKQAGTNALIGSALNIGSSFIGGASSVSGKMAAFQASGALPGG